MRGADQLRPGGVECGAFGSERGRKLPSEGPDMFVVVDASWTDQRLSVKHAPSLPTRGAKVPGEEEAALTGHSTASRRQDQASQPAETSPWPDSFEGGVADGAQSRGSNSLSLQVWSNQASRGP